MAGHSKWATTKRHKAAVDAKKGKIFSVLSKELTISAREGGGDPEFNPRLRTVIQKAKSANMPADNVERAIKKGTGELPGVVFEQLTYEGYGPGGVGIVVEVTTDNKNRSASAVRSTFSKQGCELAKPGALAFNFEKKGQFLVSADEVESEDKLMEIALEAGAEDVLNHGDHFELLCPLSEFDALAQALSDAGINAESAELAWIPNMTVPIEDKDTAKKLLKLIDTLEELEDVQTTYANYSISDSLLDGE